MPTTALGWLLWAAPFVIVPAVVLLLNRRLDLASNRVLVGILVVVLAFSLVGSIATEL